MAELKVIFMDAGQGDCTLICFPNGVHWLVDCGSMKNGEVVIDEILKVLRAQLPSQGGNFKKKINRLILTHPDRDHYNLLPDIHKEFEIDHVLHGGDLDEYSVNKVAQNILRPMMLNFKPIEKAEKNWRPENIGGANVYILAANSFPKTKRIKNHKVFRNKNSIVLLIEYKNYKFFLMGDATFKTEELIRKSAKKRKGGQAVLSLGSLGTCLKLGHHGSEKSTSEEWVRAITPTAAVISTDTKTFSNKKGLPRKGLLLYSTIENVKKWSGNKIAKYLQVDKRTHNIVFWMDDDNSMDYGLFIHKATTEAICTTLYEIKYEDSNRENFQATGGSWYFIVTQDGQLETFSTSDKSMVK